MAGPENQNFAAELPQEEKNQEILHNAELGIFLERAYIDAVNLDPRLATIDIVPMPEGSTQIAAVVPSWASESGQHTVRLRMDLDDALSSHQKVLDTVPGSRELFAQKMGLEPENVTPAALHVFSFLHEMGHITEYMEHESNPDELRKRIKQEKAALPIGNAAVSAIMTEGSPANQFVADNWEAISGQLNVDSLEDLLTLQHEAHRNMTSERIADNFAADVFTLNPSLKDALLDPAVVNDYRNVSGLHIAA